MLCSKCGAELLEGAKFCSECGTKVELPEPAESPVIEAPAAEPETAAEVVENIPEDAEEAPAIEETAPVEESAEEEKAEAPAEESAEENNTEAPAVENAEEEKAEAPAEESAEENNTETPAEESAEEDKAEAPAEESAEEDKAETPAEESAEEDKAEAPAEENVAAPVLPTVTPEPENSESGSAVKKILPKAAAVVVAGVALIGLVNFLGGKGDNTYVMLSGGDYALMTDAKKNDSFSFTSAKSSLAYPGNVKFTEDGKYVYFLTKASYDDGLYTSGTLCRAQLNKLKKGSKKNDKYIDTIATGVIANYKVLDNGDVVYMNSDSNLYYYDGKDSVSVAKDISYFSCMDDYLMYVSGNGDSNDVYYVSYKKPDEKEKIASKCSSVLRYSDKDNIIYTKYEDDYTYSIYKTGLKKEPEKIASHADLYYITDMFGEEDNGFYYSVDSDKTISLYDYVDDPHAEEDKGIKEPDIEDYTIPSYSYNMISDKNPKESDYDWLYTSCTNMLYWYGESKYFCTSMDMAVDRKWGDNTDGIVKATKSFMEKYASKADEDGWIPVTEDVKAALKEINKYGDDSIEKKDGAENQWLWLCYSKEQAGTTYDYDTYYEVRDKYSKVADRIDLRERLKDKDNDIHVKSLYYYKDGKSTLITDSMLNKREYANMLVYNTTDMVKDKLDIEDIYLSDVRELFDFSYDNENYFISAGSTTPSQLSEDTSEQIKEAAEGYGMVLYVVGDDLVMLDDEELYSAPIKKGKTEKFELITDEGEILSQRGDKLYYAADVSSSKYDRGDIYVFENGKSEKLVSDVILQNINIYDDGSMLAFTDQRSSIYYELSYFDKKGKKTVISDDVTFYIRPSKKEILYICSGELYYYNGKKSGKPIEEDVDYIWAKEEMEPVITLGGYGFYY